MKHLLTVWNPTYDADALQQHLELLLQRMAAFREGTLEEHDAYVWWGKVRSSNRQQPLPHLQDVLAEDPDAVPPYYAASGLNVDCWFRLWDIRRLVHDDTPSVVRELARLRNTRYHDRPVSIYGGMVDLPLIVSREDRSRWFDVDTRLRMIGERFWAEYDAERAGAAAMQRELRENRFGTAAWEALDPRRGRSSPRPRRYTGGIGAIPRSS